MPVSTTSIVRQYLAARDAYAQAEQVKAKAEAAMKEALACEGIDSLVVDGRKVTVTRKERLSVDIEALAAKVSRDWFRKLTAPAVKMTAFRSAMSLGSLPADIVEEVTTATVYDEVRVTSVR